jgi:hypothetical protein
MAIDERVRLENFDEVVRILKQGPDFGLHGAEAKNIGAMLENKGLNVMGHYFSTKGEKETDDETFYGKLAASVDTAMNQSASQNFIFEIQGHNAIFLSWPCIILGVDGRRQGWIRPSQNEPITSDYGKARKTFGISHDMSTDLDFHVLVINGEELKDINKELGKFCEENRLTPTLYKGVPEAHFVQDNLVKRMIRKIYEVMKGYKGK